MDELDFRTHLAANGYDDVRTLDYGPHHTPDLHTHDFSAMGMVTSGVLTIVWNDGSTTYHVGEHYEVPAGTVHSEHTGDDPATALLGIRH